MPSQPVHAYLKRQKESRVYVTGSKICHHGHQANFKKRLIIIMKLRALRKSHHCQVTFYIICT